jgi:L-lactate dehydrogenase
MDISHGIPFAHHMKVYAGSYDDITDAAIIVITAGAGQKPGESRLDLVHKNVAIFRSIIPEITSRDCKGILLIVTNPVDILTYVTLKLSHFPEARVIGSGTVLDTARLKYSIGELLGVDSKSVHAFIIGEHGDSEIAAFSCANISGIGPDEFCEMRGYRDHIAKCREIAHEVKNLAYEIIEKKQATYYGIAMSVRRICEVIIRDEKSILPVSRMMHGEYGVDHVALSMPAIVGKDGVETHVPLTLDAGELEALSHSARTLRGILDECGLEES